MASRSGDNASIHDAVVRAAKEIYQRAGYKVFINPDGEKNLSWNNGYIDVIALDKSDELKAHVIEIETEDSVNRSEAESQWISYDKAYYTCWHLAVPESAISIAQQLLNEFKIKNCRLLSWTANMNGTYNFNELPGILNWSLKSTSRM